MSELKERANKMHAYKFEKSDSTKQTTSVYFGSVEIY
jgi:hypothetical protein